MKLYATLETSRGKTVSVSDNKEIIATIYDGNMKAYSVRIEWTDVGDIIDNDGKPLPDNMRVMGAIISHRDWRNRPETNDRKKAQRKNDIKENTCKGCGQPVPIGQVVQLYCRNCIAKPSR